MAEAPAHRPGPASDVAEEAFRSACLNFTRFGLRAQLQRPRAVPRNCHCLGHLPRVPTEDGPYIGIAPTVSGFLSWHAGVRRLGSVGAMVFYNTLPLYGALLGHLFLGESSGMAYLVGGALIIGGGLWAARGRSLDR